jgi:hypothetical protein
LKRINRFAKRQRLEDGGQKSEDGGQRTEGQRTIRRLRRFAQIRKKGTEDGLKKEDEKIRRLEDEKGLTSNIERPTSNEKIKQREEGMSSCGMVVWIG